MAVVAAVLAAAALLILFAAYAATPHLDGYAPHAVFSSILKDSESSFNLTLGEVHGEFRIEECGASVTGNDAFFLDSHPQYFDLLTKRITLNLTEDTTPPNSTDTSWVGVNFTVQFVDINDDGMVTEGDGLHVSCNQQLRDDAYYLIFLTWHCSTLCYEDYPHLGGSGG